MTVSFCRTPSRRLDPEIRGGRKSTFPVPKRPSSRSHRAQVLIWTFPEPGEVGQRSSEQSGLIGTMKCAPNLSQPDEGRDTSWASWRAVRLEAGPYLPHQGENEGPIPPVDRSMLSITWRRDWGRIVCC